MGVTIATTRVASNTSTGNQTITTADLGGLTPVAATFIITRATSDGTAADHASMGIGFAVSSSERLAVATSDEHGQGAADTYRRATEDECVMILNPTDGSVDGEADFVSFSADGCTINWGNAPASAYLLTVIFFAGTDVSAHVDTFAASGTEDASVDVTDPGFEPDVVFVASHRSAWDDSVISNSALSWGCAVNDGADTNFSVNLSGDDGAGSAVNAENSRSNRAAMNIFTSSEFGSYQLNTFDASGFSVTTKESAAGGTYGYLALNFNGAASVWLGDISSPTSTGDDAEANPGFTPQAVIAGFGRDPTFSDTQTNNQQTDVYSVGVGVTTATAEFSNMFTSEDGVTTMNTQSLSDDVFVNQQPDGGGTTDDVVGTGPPGSGSFDASTGFTINYSAVDTGSAYAYWGVAIEATAAAAARRIFITSS